MKNLTKFLVLMSLTLLLTSGSGFGQPPFSGGVFDENGVGTNFFGTVFPSSLQVDPISGLTTLCYTLPVSVASGDILYYDQSLGSNHLSDIIRFEGNRLYFFSLEEPEEHEPTNRLADVPVLPALQPNFVGPIPEGLFYSPFNGQIGSTALSAFLYDFKSDVPEPSSLSLLSLTGLLATLWRLKKRRLRVHL